MVKQTLTENYLEIQRIVLRKLKDLDCLDSHFGILFQEFTYIQELIYICMKLYA